MTVVEARHSGIRGAYPEEFLPPPLPLFLCGITTQSVFRSTALESGIAKAYLDVLRYGSTVVNQREPSSEILVSLIARAQRRRRKNQVWWSILGVRVQIPSRDSRGG